jgi:hypothetical protein
VGMKIQIQIRIFCMRLFGSYEKEDSCLLDETSW